MSRRARVALLVALKAVGGFLLARILTGNALRILCYHGVSQADEHLFRSGLFITKESFKGRMEWLTRAKFQVLELNSAILKLNKASLPRRAVVITFDDGWYSSLAGVPELRRRGFPATFYVTTYYVTKDEPVFNLLVAYAMWRAGKRTLAIDGKEQAAEEITSDGSALGSGGRERVMRKVAELTGASFDELASSRRFGLMNLAELRSLEEMKFDIQLHTHRHRMPASDEELRREIADNRRALGQATKRPLEHFCYPSGRYHSNSDRILSNLKVVSATTCDAGLNYQDTSPFFLRRLVDSERVTQIEFEAEMSGLFELARRPKQFLRNILAAKST